MPIKPCNENKKPGWQYGDSGKCYTYSPDKSGAASTTAKKKAIKQAVAIHGGVFKEASTEEEYAQQLEDIAQKAFDSYIKQNMKKKDK